jgi:hypothetical protein
MQLARVSRTASVTKFLACAAASVVLSCASTTSDYALLAGSQFSESEVRASLAPIEPYTVVAAIDLRGGIENPGSSKEEIAANLVVHDPGGRTLRPLDDDSIDPRLREVLVRMKQRGQPSIDLFDTHYSWRLPIGSLVLPRTGPVDGEMLNGAWDYCPWHGVRLE